MDKVKYRLDLSDEHLWKLWRTLNFGFVPRIDIAVRAKYYPHRSYTR